MSVTEITIDYDEDCPLTTDGDLRVDRRENYVLEKHLFEVVSHDPEHGRLVVAVQVPERPCRFLGHQDGYPPACYGFGNASPYYMENSYAGQAPEIVCLHCAEYAGGREERRQERDSIIDDRGTLRLLPELDENEAGVYIDYIDRDSGKIVHQDE